MYVSFRVGTYLGPCTILNASGISQVYRGATGVYSVKFDESLPDKNYSVFLSQNITRDGVIIGVEGQKSEGFDIITRDVAHNNKDGDIISALVYKNVQLVSKL